MIEALKSDEIVSKLGGRFKLTALIQRRMLELMEGARPLVDREHMTDLEVVIQEILQDKITIDWEASGMVPPKNAARTSVATPSDIDSRRYFRVAHQRLEDGRLMLERLDRPRASVYLTGYAAECILKSLLIERTSVGQRQQLVASFRGQRAHSLDWLQQLLREQGIIVPKQLKSDLLFISSWSVDLRYEPGPGDASDAERFVAATTRLLEWASGAM